MRKTLGAALTSTNTCMGKCTAHTRARTRTHVQTCMSAHRGGEREKKIRRRGLLDDRKRSHGVGDDVGRRGVSDSH